MSEEYIEPKIELTREWTEYTFFITTTVLTGCLLYILSHNWVFTINTSTAFTLSLLIILITYKEKFVKLSNIIVYRYEWK